MTATCEPGVRPRGAFYQSVLAPHPSTPCDAVRSIAVRLARTSPQDVELAYGVSGDLGRVRLPESEAPRRGDGLWRHTCFEVFVVPDPGPAYVELNFSSCGAWACYAFTRYREGQSTPELVVPPSIGVTASTHDPAWVLTASVRLEALRGGVAARVAVAAVIEEVGGRLSYWALQHAPGRPDFHRPEGFVWRI